MRAVVGRLVIPALLVAAAACRRAPVRALPAEPPSYAGLIVGRSFATASATPGGMYRIQVRRGPGDPARYPALEAFIRLDTATAWAIAEGRRVSWTTAGVPDLRRAHVRVWLRGAPTSLTETELWGNAAVVVVDSLQPTP